LLPQCNFFAKIKMSIMTICIHCQNLKLIFYIEKMMRITIWRFSKWQHMWISLGASLKKLLLLLKQYQMNVCVSEI
jgi:hypothetical protein